jgi:L-iditol 2-dehydrogenase
MISAVYTQGKGFAVEESPVPEIGPDEILVKVEAAALCGTDVKIAKFGHRTLTPGQRIVLGHEFAGSVERVGSRVSGFSEGMRVGVAPNWGCGECPACRNGMSNMCPVYKAFGVNTDGSHAPYVRIPSAPIAQQNVIRLQEDMAWEQAALAEPLSCVINGQNAVRFSKGERILIYGAGPMGMLHLLLARATGASKIVMVDQNPGRLSQALEIGADVAVNNAEESVADALKAAGLAGGVDAAVIAVPVRDLAREALGLLATFGRLCLFAGLSGDPDIVLDSNAIHYRNLCVTGTTGGSVADYRQAIDLIGSGRVDVRSIISHRFPLEQLEEAYRVAMAGGGLKIVLTAGGC